MEVATLSVLLAFFVMNLISMALSYKAHEELIYETRETRETIRREAGNLHRMLEVSPAPPLPLDQAAWMQKMFEKLTDAMAVDRLGREAPAYFQQKRLEKMVPKPPSPPSVDEKPQWPPPGVSAVIRSEG